VPGVVHSIGQTYLKRRYTILFYTLVFTIVASPIIAAFGLSGAVIDSLLAASLLVAVMPVHAGRIRNLMLAVLIVMWLAHPVTARLGFPILSEMTRVTWTLIGLLAAAAALRFAMRGAKVYAEHVYAALSAYLLAGIYFGNLYWALEQVHPGTLTATDFSRSAAIYFSFVTLATIGYGDILPRTEVARALAIIEGVGGQLFLAVLVARLLSLYSKSAAD
jgi:Ion channel